MNEETTPKLSVWQQFLKVLRNPISVLSDKTKDSPLITILAIVFILQPVLSTGVDIIREMVEVKQQLDPENRPVTKSELDIVNTKIDFIQQLIVTDMQRDAAAEQNRLEYRRKHDHDNQVSAAAPAAPPAKVAATPAQADDIRSHFGALNKRLELIQAPLDKKYALNAKK